MSATKLVEIGYSAIDANSRVFRLEVIKHEVRDNRRDRYTFAPISARQEKDIRDYLRGARPDFKGWFDAELEPF